MTATPADLPHGAGVRCLRLSLSRCSQSRAGWFAYAYLSGTEAAPDSEDKLALSIIGGWWNIAGDRHLTLEWEGRRATLHDYAKSDAGVESVGSWRTSKDTVTVHVRGAAGELTQELELVGNDAEMFLAPHRPNRRG